MGLDTVKQAIADIAEGKFVIVVDEASREDEGDLIIAGEDLSVEKMAFLLKYTTGIVCASLEQDRLQALRLPPMVRDNRCPFRTAFTVSVDAAKDITTGVSAADRTKTALLLASPSSQPCDFVSPGHFFPLMSAPGGVLKRAGHTEAAMDLAKLAGKHPCGILAELVNEDQSMMRLPDILTFAKTHGLTVISVADLIAYRHSLERLVVRVSSAKLPTKYGEFAIHVYEAYDGVQHIALVKGEVSGEQDVLVRVHSECLTGDIFGSCRCDCGNQLQAAMEYIAKAGKGVVVYLRGQEGRGIGLAYKVRAYALQDSGLDTVDANLQMGLPVDSREYGIGAQILVDLGLTTIRLLTHNPKKYFGLQGFGLSITDRVPLPIAVKEENLQYLRTKKERMGHWIDFPSVENTLL